jgi:uncharacterized repeat protein (TIGR02543 family)
VNAADYTVAFDANGGETPANPQTMQVVSPATTVGTLPEAPAWAGYIFTGWNTQEDGTGAAFTAATAVTANITVYAQWNVPPPPEARPMVSFSDPGDTAFDQETFTVVRGGSPGSRTITLTGAWTSGEWRVDGRVRGAGTSLTIDAADYTLGGHVLEVVVLNEGTPWSKTLRFTVAQAAGGISLNKTSLTLPAGGSETLFAVISPANASDKSVAWSSNAPAIASVDASTGLVSAGTAPGTAVITARANDGGYTATCTVSVVTAQGISLLFSDPGDAAFDQETFTVVRGGSPGSQTITLTGAWTSGEWRVDGRVRGTGTIFIVNAADYTAGGHVLEVVVLEGSTPWSKTLRFTVSN